MKTYRSLRRFYIQLPDPVAMEMKCGRTCSLATCSCHMTSLDCGSWASRMCSTHPMANSAVKEVMTFMALTSGGKVLVHCAVGVSRSAALVLAYLMIHHHLSLLAAIHCVQHKRWIFPNRGFLRQLIKLNHDRQTGSSNTKLPNDVEIQQS
ncbi:dual specificity protein phosphatase 5-like isoform X4 [Synchiropus splendidus]|uniref:dual specificity protein phosphatase 5-like isoform X4 n=1 Tax=Synchiropus splendidus TaxID=270530 RepID=UPI00237D355B|nr:dual specificity protein phosphatase 5-like isoform X4 [Synchiropus splendidus]